MQLTKPIMLLIVGSALAVGIIRLTFLSVSNSKVIAGCPANLSQDGIDPTQTVAFWQLIAHQGSEIFLESPISSGLFGKTRVGEYAIWYKIRATKMEGGVRGTGTYYYLPNVPYTMFFDREIGVHGTYWHQNFGKPMSHGCVNAPTPIAEKLFYWADPQVPDGKWAVRSSADNPGTRVVVHE